ncbi:MAG TPA: hypothetical protein VNF29_14900 [Candidatus Binataceae bacterium]|nr:hypothetical protein [Candidatus Binataceae bacterium]
MRHSRTRIIIDGATAGILGGVVVALWFLLFDLSRGHGFETPALLAATLLHGLRDPNLMHQGVVRLVAEYTMLHFCAFIIVGVVAALLLEAAENEPPFLISVLIFFGAFETFFVAVVLFLGPQVMAALTWWGIIVGNLLATGAMLTYFFWRHPMLAKHLFGSGWLRVTREGILAGVVGAVVVAIWFLGYDLASGDLFRTPTLLGAMIFLGADATGAAHASVALVLGYTVLHFFAFICFGLAIAILLAASEWEPFLALGVFLLFAVFEVFFVGFVTVLDSSVVSQLGWWKIVAGNILALLAMTAYFLQGHRGLRLKLVERWATLDMDGQEMGELGVGGGEPHPHAGNGHPHVKPIQP